MSEKKKAEVISPGMGEIDRVRDILFGREISNIDDRFDELDKKFQHKYDALAAQLAERSNDMLSKLEAEVEQLKSDINAATNDAGVELNQIDTKLEKAQETLHHAVQLVDDYSQQQSRELQQSLESMNENLREEITGTRQQLEKHSKDTQESLQADKVSREALALLLDEVAMKLRGSS